MAGGLFGLGGSSMGGLGRMRRPKKPIGVVPGGGGGGGFGGGMDRGMVAGSLSGKPIGGGKMQLGAGSSLMAALDAFSGHAPKGFEMGAGAATKIPGYKPGDIQAIAAMPKGPGRRKNRSTI